MTTMEQRHPPRGPMPMPPQSQQQQMRMSAEEIAALKMQHVEKIRMSCVDCAVKVLTTHAAPGMLIDERKSFVVEAAKAFYDFVKGNEEKTS